jgi:hypothetical protein
MQSPFTSFLFADHRIATATSGQGKFTHTFGGPHDRKGSSRKECNGILIHLLHRFDLTDPTIPIAIPGVRWLPLYYCFDFRVNHLGYRLIRDDAMTVFFPKDPNVTENEEWPSENYPQEFPKSNIKTSPYPYDPTVIKEALEWAAVFGLGQLSKRDQATAKKQIAKRMVSFGFEAPRTEKEFAEAVASPFMQGRPNDACLNPECANFHERDQLTPIALVPSEPVKGVDTYPVMDVQIIFALCPKCYTIRVSNQCT